MLYRIRPRLDFSGRDDEALSPHLLSDNDLDPDRQRAATKGMDVADFVDLLTRDERLRKYEHLGVFKNLDGSGNRNEYGGESEAR